MATVIYTQILNNEPKMLNRNQRKEGSKRHSIYSEYTS